MPSQPPGVHGFMCASQGQGATIRNGKGKSHALLKTPYRRSGPRGPTPFREGGQAPFLGLAPFPAGKQVPDPLPEKVPDPGTVPVTFFFVITPSATAGLAA